MNHTYRLIWNDLLRAWIAAAEFARARGKRSGGAVLLAAATLSAPARALDANALPGGGQSLADGNSDFYFIESNDAAVSFLHGKRIFPLIVFYFIHKNKNLLINIYNYI